MSDQSNSDSDSIWDEVGEPRGYFARMGGAWPFAHVNRGQDQNPGHQTQDSERGIIRPPPKTNPTPGCKDPSEGGGNGNDKGPDDGKGNKGQAPGTDNNAAQTQGGTQESSAGPQSDNRGNSDQTRDRRCRSYVEEQEQGDRVTAYQLNKSYYRVPRSNEEQRVAEEMRSSGKDVPRTYTPSLSDSHKRQLLRDLGYDVDGTMNQEEVEGRALSRQQIADRRFDRKHEPRHDISRR